MLCTIFEIERAPCKDTWHGLNGVLKTCYPVNRDEKSAFGRDLSAALMTVHEPDVSDAVRYLRSSWPEYDPTSARREALESYTTRGRIRTKFNPVSLQVQKWNSVRTKWEGKAAVARENGDDSCIRHTAGKIKVRCSSLAPSHLPRISLTPPSIPRISLASPSHLPRSPSHLPRISLAPSHLPRISLTPPSPR